MPVRPDVAPATNVMRGLLETNQIAEAFGVLAITIYKWRRGRGLPYIRIPGRRLDAIRYRWPAVRKWAETNKIPIKQDPRALSA